MSDKYILDKNGNPIACCYPLVWGMWLQNANLIVKQEVLPNTDIKISTVFLGLDHGFGQGPPILWETMTFSKTYEDLDGHQNRCSGNREQAEAMHEVMKLRMIEALQTRTH